MAQDQWGTYQFEFAGGLITNLSPLQLGSRLPGSARVLRNFEPSIEGGYRRVEGFTKFDTAHVPPYGDPRVQGASQSGTDLDIANIFTSPVAGDTLTLTHATAQINNTATAVVNGTVSSSTSVAVDGNSGSIVVGMVVSGTGVDSSITVTTVTDQQNIVISSAQSIANDVALTFTAPDSVNTTYIVDTITGTIATGLTVVGSGIADGVTVTGFTASTSTITLSTGLDLTENLELTFKKTYTIASGGVSFSSANKSATLTLTGALASSPTDQALVEFGNTSDTIEGIVYFQSREEDLVPQERNTDLLSTDSQVRIEY